MKKIFIFTFIFIFAMQGITLAAIGGSKPKSFSAPKSNVTTPKKSEPSSSKPADSQNKTSPSGEYKPSTKADSYSQTAPSPKTATPSTSPQQSTGSSFMRGLGLLGGGMLLGSLFGGALGETLGPMLGVLLDILVVVGIFLVGRSLWRKIKKRQQGN